MMTSDLPQLSVDLIDNDADFPGFAVEARADSYSGATDVWISRTEVVPFLDALDALDSQLNKEARLVAGWSGAHDSKSSGEADLELTIRPFGKAGQLEVEVLMRASARWERRHIAHLTFRLPEHNALTAFRKALRAMVMGQNQGPVVLTPVSTATASNTR
jgi:hypothetical protein